MAQSNNKKLMQRLAAYDVDVRLSVTGLEKAQICICCLSQDVPFVNLSKCKHADFLKNCSNYKHEYVNSLACHACHNNLKKIATFKQQVVKSFCLLKKQVRHLKSNLNSPKLGCSEIEITSNIPHKFDIKLEEISTNDRAEDTTNQEETSTNDRAEDTSTNQKEASTNDRAEDTTNQKEASTNDRAEDTTTNQEEASTNDRAEDTSTNQEEASTNDRAEDTSTNQEEASTNDRAEDTSTNQEKASTNDRAEGTSTNQEADIFFNQELKNVQEDHDDTILEAEAINWLNDASDLETDLPLSVVKEKKKNIQGKKVDKLNKVKLSTVETKPKKQNKVTEKKDKLDIKKKKKIYKCKEKYYKGKISMKHLTLEEVMAERDRDRKEESYVKLTLKCDTCIIGFHYETPYLDHMARKHTLREGSYQCHICKTVVDNEVAYKAHYKRHFTRYECGVCGRRNSTFMAIEQHYAETHGAVGKEFKCPDCEYTTSLPRQYRYHLFKHRSAARCVQCLKDFYNRAGLRLHMYTVHAQSSPVFSCKTCNQDYKFRSGLVRHLAKTGHGAPSDAPSGAAPDTAPDAAPDAAPDTAPPNFCKPCQKFFRTKDGLRAHLRTHSKHISDSKMLECDECGQKFVLKVRLVEHINWSHLHKIHYTCTKCSKSFKNKQSLQKHKNFVHDKKQPPRDYICDHCGRGFTRPIVLQHHIRTHTGERPLHCKHCTATFGHSAALYRHIKSAHGGGSRQSRRENEP